jgi:hypothetical protein
MEQQLEYLTDSVIPRVIRDVPKGHAPIDPRNLAFAVVPTPPRISLPWLP